MSEAPNVAPEWQNMVTNLEKSSGKTLDEWLKITKDSGIAKHGELVKYLKETYGIGHGYANMVAHISNSSAADMSDDRDAFVAQQYSGGKANLRPIYDRLVEIISGFGDDIQFVPMKAYVSVKRSKQFACLQPSTKTRFDVGIKLKNTPPTARLEEGGFNGMVSHHVSVTSADEIDSELIGWLRQAYESA